MNFCNKEYMSKLFKFSNEVDSIEMRFKDENIEQKYYSSNVEDEKNKSISFLIFSISIYLFGLAITLIRSIFKTSRTFYILIGGLILEVFNYVITKKYITRLNFSSQIKNLRFLCLYSILGIIIIFPFVTFDPKTCTAIRSILGFMFLINFLFLFLKHVLYFIPNKEKSLSYSSLYFFIVWNLIA